MLDDIVHDSIHLSVDLVYFVLMLVGCTLIDSG